MIESVIRGIVDFVSHGFLFILWWSLLSCTLSALLEWALRPLVGTGFWVIKWTRVTCVLFVLLLMIWRVYW